MKPDEYQRKSGSGKKKSEHVQLQNVSICCFGPSTK